MSEIKVKKPFIPPCENLIKPEKINFDNLRITVKEKKEKKGEFNYNLELKGFDPKPDKYMSDAFFGLKMTLKNSAGYLPPFKPEQKTNRALLFSFNGHDLNTKEGKKMKKCLDKCREFDAKIIDMFTEHEYNNIQTYKQSKDGTKSKAKGKKSTKKAESLDWWLSFIKKDVENDDEDILAIDKEKLRKIITKNYNPFVKKSKNEEYPPFIKLKLMITKDYEFLTKVWTNDKKQFTLVEDDKVEEKDMKILSYPDGINPKKEQIKMTPEQVFSKGPDSGLICCVRLYIMDKEFGITAQCTEMKIKEDVDKLKLSGKTNENRLGDDNSDSDSDSDSETNNVPPKAQAQEPAKPEEPKQDETNSESE